ncbi:MAG: metal-dependent transcriptional regulator [Synergistaceae bacterium]|nr:metal-dependent transcriptional regulator [Synergistaceae bacterium]
MRESGENYLKTILILKERNGSVRSIDVANEMGYSKPSISRAVKLLIKRGHVIMESNGELILTKKGYHLASDIYERHEVISEFLVKLLGVNKEVADRDACRVEHAISEESFEKLKDFVKMNYQ